MKNFSLVRSLGATLVVIFSVACTTKNNSLPQKPLVTVEQYQLSSEEFGRNVIRRAREFDSLYAKQKDTVDRIKAEVVSEFISASIVSSWASKNGIAILESDLEKEVNRIRASYPDDISFRNAFALEGQTFEAWREEVRHDLLERAVFDRIAKEGAPKPTDKDVLEYYNSHKSELSRPARIKLRQVVLEKEEDARRVMARLRQGGSGGLEKMARDYSIAPEAKQGGETGWIEKGALPVFDEAFKLAPGVRSDIIKSPYGYHIYEVIAKKAQTQLSLAEAKASIVKNLSAQFERNQFEKWLGEQSKLVKVFKDDALIDSITVHTEGQK